MVSDGSANSGNATNNAGSTAGGKDDGKIVIGMSMDTLKEERWQKDRDLFTAKVEELGGEVKVLA
ncbi:D-xylose ABC transporter substrate-binding protein, partial [Paenibacillus barengoltzii]|nr:D-xylose ABC transporter substrate-binding protein [Paenibacillus barengoltzii]